MNEKYNYNLSGSDRKPLVEAISQILDKPAVYQGAPSFSYIIGDYTVDRNGVLSYDSNIHPDYAAVLVEDLRERGFVAERVATENDNEAINAEGATDTVENEPSSTEENTDAHASADAEWAADTNEVADACGENATAETEAADAVPEESPENNVPAEDDESAENGNIPEAIQSDDTPTQLIVEVPSAGFTPETMENLKKIVASKATLLGQSLGTDNLSVKELDGKIVFPWFTLHGLDGEADAYNRLVAALCNMAKNQKRVVAVEKPVENAKFDMRLFLVRLGFVGDEYKTAHRILLKNLTGNSAWKSGHKPERLAGNADSSTTSTDPGHANDAVPMEAMPVDTETADPLENKNEGGEDYGKE